MADIRILPELITNQIAAGEVVERPVSVVKELMENALDAHATHIKVAVDRGGRDLIRVSDDGDGMSRDNALLSIERYATSKLATAEDLFSIATLGFRGEALPSIAAVSKMTITTREKDADYGTRLFLNGGKLIEVSEIGAPPGTMVEIRNLYFNTPVRRKFLKTVNTEMAHIADAFSAMAMGTVGVGFSLVHNGRLVRNFTWDQPLDSRVKTVLGGEASLVLHPVACQKNDVEIQGFIADPSHTRSGSQRILFFVNGRMVTDKGVLSALLQGFRGRIMKGRFPMAVLFITLPFDGVDVNVHPAKLQVRFVNEKGVYGAVRQAVGQALALAERQQPSLSKSPRLKDNDPSPSIRRTSASVDKVPSYDVPSQISDVQGSAVSEERTMKFHDEEKSVPSLFQWGGSDRKKKDAFREPSLPEPPQQADPSFHGDAHLTSHADKNISVNVGEDKVKAGNRKGGEQAGKEKDTTLDRHMRVVGQVMGTYIIVETMEGVTLIDQHAAHERIVYEQLKRRSKTFRPPSQHLLVPEVLDLNFAQTALLEKMIPALRDLGFELEPFGGTTVVLKSVPALIDHCNVRGLIHDMVDAIMESGLESGDDGSHGEAWLDECLILMACHNSVRANQTMTPKEMEALVHQLDACENAYHCPHGRPIRVMWSQRDFERMFKRIK